MRKTYVIVIVFAALFFIIVASFALPSVVSVIKNEKNNQRCQDEMEEHALQYLEQNVEGFNRTEWKFTRCYSEGRETKVDEYNSANPSDYIYPYSKTKIYFAENTLFPSNVRWVVYFQISNEMKHEVVGCELITVKE